MVRPRPLARRLLVLAGLAAGLAASGAAAAYSLQAGDTILNTTQRSDRVGDTLDGGVDISSLTVSTYADASMSLAMRFANRDLLSPGETVQVFVDLDGNGSQDLDLSLWPTGAPSYLDRWSGTAWTHVRQLPELVQTNGMFSLRLTLADLRGAAAVVPGATVGVLAGAWSIDPATGALRANADDWLPDNRAWIRHSVEKPPAPPLLAVRCAQHVWRATIKARAGSTVSSVAFSANGRVRVNDVKAPFAAAISTKGLHGLVTIGATVHLDGRTVRVRKRVRGC